MWAGQGARAQRCKHTEERKGLCACVCVCYDGEGMETCIGRHPRGEVVSKLLGATVVKKKTAGPA